MSKIKFVRGLWGEDGSRKMEEIKKYMPLAADTDNKLAPKLYVFGKKNYEFVKDRGLECQLLNDSPIVYKNNFRHKLEVMKAAAQDFGKCIFLDWHVILDGDLPNDFYQSFQEGAPIKASLRIYRQRKAKWRKEDQRKVPASDMLYMGGPRAIDELIESLGPDDSKVHSDTALMKYIDFLTGKWRGVEYYGKYFEIPNFSNTWSGELFPDKVKSSFADLKDIDQNNKVRNKVRDTPPPSAPVPTPAPSIPQEALKGYYQIPEDVPAHVKQRIMERQRRKSSPVEVQEAVPNVIEELPETIFPVYKSDSIQTKMFTSTIVG